MLRKNTAFISFSLERLSIYLEVRKMLPHTINTTEHPQLVLFKQTSLCEEYVPSKNGGQKTLHTVVKNSPFTISFGFDTNAKQIDLNKYTIEVSLHYDAENFKEV